MKSYHILLLSLFCAFFSCKKEAKTTELAKKFCLTDTLKKGLQTAVVENKIIENEIVLSGKITFDEDKVAKVYPLAGGFVKDLRANLGDYVQRGQVLAIIRSPEIAGFNNDKNAAAAQLRMAEKTYSVTQELFKTGTVSELEVINAKKDFETAKANLNRSSEVVSMYNVGNESFYSIVAPQAGFVVQKDVALNMELRTEDIKPIFVIANMEDVWVKTNIYESDIEQVKVGFDASISTIAYPDTDLKGKVDKIFNTLDPESKVLNARIILQNPGYKLKPDMYAKVVVRNPNTTEKQLSIPAKAVIFSENRYFVMVYKADCDIEIREIVPYKETQTTMYVANGLKEGEKIMTKYQLLAHRALND